VRSFYDVNVLIALFDPQHIARKKASAWHEAHFREGWATCPITENGLLRIVCQPKYSNPSTVSTLRTQLQKATASEFHQFWSDDVSLADSRLIDENALLTSSMLTDVYLLMLAVKNNGRLVTLDSRISTSAVIGATPEHLVVL
jgi:uncharacterized protein